MERKAEIRVEFFKKKGCMLLEKRVHAFGKKGACFQGKGYALLRKR